MLDDDDNHGCIKYSGAERFWMIRPVVDL